MFLILSGVVLLCMGLLFLGFFFISINNRYVPFVWELLSFMCYISCFVVGVKLIIENIGSVV